MPVLGDKGRNPPGFISWGETPHEIGSLIDGRDDRCEGNDFGYCPDPFFRWCVDIDPILDHKVVPFEEVPVEGRDRDHEEEFLTAVEKKR